MNKKLLILVVPFLLNTCSDIVVIDSREEPPIVVNCILKRDGGFFEDHPDRAKGYNPPMQYLDLYYARRPSEIGYEPISNAEVVIKGKGNTYNFIWNGSRWECAFLPEFNIVYKLTVITDAGIELRSQMQFPPDCRLCKYRLIESTNKNFFGSTYAGYYYIRQHYDDIHTQCMYKCFHGDCFFWVMAKEGGKYVSKICTSHSGVDDFNIRRDRWKDCAVVGEYETDFYACMQTQNDFYAKYNPDDYKGSVGFVEPFFVDPDLWHRYSSAWLQSPLHDVYLRINHTELYDSGLNQAYSYYVANDFEEQPVATSDLFVIGADFDPTRVAWEDGLERPWYIDSFYEVHFVSEDYDKYLRSLSYKAIVHKDEITTNYSPDIVYSNIEGGLGCFGGEFLTKVAMSK